jgi:hypothetical protein
MVQFRSGILVLLATLTVLTVLVGRAVAHPPAMTGWDLEKAAPRTAEKVAGRS